MKYDIIIIGAGILGASIARELSRYQINVAVLDKENDVGNVTSMANSAIIHSGYDPLPGTNKAKFNVLGNKMYDQIADELDVSFERIGSLTVALYDEQLPMLEELSKRSKENGVEVTLLNKEEVLKLEPNINPNVKGALFAPTAGIIDPFNLVVHTMENAVDNGVNLFLNEKVVDIIYADDDITIKTKKNHEYHATMVINAAGLASDKIASMVAPIDWKITPRKGEYFVLDHYKLGLVNHVIFPLPSEKGKGILVSRTTSNNYIVGPSSEEIDDIDDLSTDTETLSNVKEQALDLVPSIPFNQTIRVFSGNRATCSKHDFVIEQAKDKPHFINIGGIESPGLVSSPAIAKYVVDEFVKNTLVLQENPKYNPRIRPYIHPKNLSSNDRNALIKAHPEYGEIVCFCEQVSLGEVKDALSRSVPPHSVKAMKKRVRAGFGKCQGGFCQPRILKELASFYKLDYLDVLYDEEGSNILIEDVKEPQR